MGFDISLVRRDEGGVGAHAVGAATALPSLWCSAASFSPSTTVVPPGEVGLLARPATGAWPPPPTSPNTLLQHARMRVRRRGRTRSSWLPTCGTEQSEHASKRSGDDLSVSFASCRVLARFSRPPHGHCKSCILSHCMSRRAHVEDGQVGMGLEMVHRSHTLLSSPPARCTMTEATRGSAVPRCVKARWPAAKV